MIPTVVVDASVALKWLLPEPGRVAANALLERAAGGEVRLIGPPHLAVEVASALTRLCRRKLLMPDQARRLYRLYRRIAPGVVESEALTQSAMELALAHQLSVWEAVYLAMAVAEGGTMVTADQRFCRAAGPAFAIIRYLGE